MDRVGERSMEERTGKEKRIASSHIHNFISHT